MALMPSSYCFFTKPDCMSSVHQVNERYVYCEAQVKPRVKEVSTQKPEAFEFFFCF